MRYGTRIYRRKGCWLTALTAAVLLAASPGTAQAQVEITGPDEVAEGGTATYTVSVKGFATPGGVADTLTVTLETPSPDSDPAATTGEAGDLSTNVPLTFTVETPAGPTEADGVVGRAFSATGTIRLQTLHDVDAEDEVFDLTFALTDAGNLVDAAVASGGDPILLAADDFPDALTIEDDETQSYDLTVDEDEPKEGDSPITVTVTANPAHEDGSANLTVQIDSPPTLASITDPATATLDVIDVTNPTRTATVTLDGNDKNRVDDTVTVSVYSGSAGNATLVDSLSITIEDKDALPAVAVMVVDEDGDALDPQPTAVEEGKSVEVAVMVVDKDGDVIEAAEALTVQLMPTGTADSADYILVGSFDIDMGMEMSENIEIEVRPDEDVGRESLMFNAVVTGDSANGPGTRTSEGVLSLYIEDATAKKIEPKATEADYDAIKAAIAEGAGEDGLNPGDTVTLMTSDLFDLMDGYTASYGVSVEGDSASASASGESVTINALMAGEAKITVTGTARMASSSLIPTQTVSNVAELTFPVTVVDTTLVVTLSADPMEIEAGGTTMITATASRAVTADDGAVTVDLTVVGDGELDADSITIAMGELSGSATLTANESVTVVATGSGVSGLMQVMVTVTDAAEPVPALSLIAQWLLGLGLLGGGARQLHRRRRQG